MYETAKVSFRLNLEFIYDSNPSFSLFQVCTFIFLIEMILKLIAFKFRGYIKSRWNIFDGIVVVISLIDTVLTLSNFIDNTGTSVLRSFRLVSISNH